jgi:hypothetical protein
MGLVQTLRERGDHFSAGSRGQETKLVQVFIDKRLRFTRMRRCYEHSPLLGCTQFD